MPPRAKKSKPSSSHTIGGFSIESTTEIATLWAGYGTISRLTLPTSPTTPSTLILKRISSPPLSTSLSESDARKIISYYVERWFYANLTPLLPESVRLPGHYPTKEGEEEGLLLLEDLEEEFDVDGGGRLTTNQTTLVLNWLAQFHATYTNLPSSTVPNLISSPNPSNPSASFASSASPTAALSLSSISSGIWAQGSYYHLRTRLSEHSSILNSKAHAWWLPYAEWVDANLSDPRSVGRTIIHGDVKSANIAFSRKKGGEESVVLWDFQYVGMGLGVRDVVYFLATSVDARALEKDGWKKLLREYWEAVDVAQRCRAPSTGEERGERAGGGEEYTWEVCQEQFGWACVD
ncbi:hypothetical protein P7C70_g8474, partial [Phenoliferia sp. Uapishka_3]